MKMVFISGDLKFEGVELDSTIPVPRTGEFVLLKDDGATTYQIYKVNAVFHYYHVMAIFIYVEKYKS
jgi:hypothetical protein